jgi:hypothetical protein
MAGTAIDAGTVADLGGLSNLCRSLFTSRYSRGFGHAGLRHFFRDAGKECFVRFFFGFRSCHTRHDVIKPEAIMFTLEQGRLTLRHIQNSEDESVSFVIADDCESKTK